MAEENKVEEGQQTTEVNPEAEGAEEGAKKKSNILLVAIIALLVVLTSIVGAVVLKSGSDEEATKQAEVVAPQPSVFFEMPELIVSLSGHSSNIRYLKLVLSFELASPEDEAVVLAQLPKITDEFQTYLRQLRLEDLRGSVGTYRLKEALLLRVNQVVQPVEAKNVLIKEMLIQ
jgi:flagellar FliL protein